jgi:hypothetical protein
MPSDQEDFTDIDPDPEIGRNLSFSQEQPNLQLSWDQTSLGELKICPQKYKYSIIDGYEPRDTNVHFIFGGIYHHAFEFFDHRIAEGQDYKSAVQETVTEVLLKTWRPDLGRPWPSDNPTKNRGTLIRSVIWYLDQFKDDPLETIILHDGKPAVEHSFRIELGCQSSLTGEAFLLCGHIDKLVLFEGRPAIVDKKTTKNAIGGAFFLRFSPDNQVSAYMLAGGFILDEPVTTMIIDAAQILVNSTRFQRGIIHRTPDQLHEWLKDTWIWIAQAEQYAKMDYWPKNDKACGQPTVDPKTGEVRYGCPFREVCASDQSMRQMLLDANFNRRTWDPIQPRELKRSTP